MVAVGVGAAEARKQGQDFHDKGDYDKAIEAFTRAIEADDKAADVARTSAPDVLPGSPPEAPSPRAPESD